jgi:dCTP deaminase
MILSDRSLREALRDGRIAVDPLAEGALQPSSIDLRLDALFRVFRNYSAGFLDLAAIPEDLTEVVEVPFGSAFILHPGEFVLGATIERITVADDLVARLEGKSSLGRLGLLIHSTAGFIDPGFTGHVTLELSNVAQLPITLYPGMRVGQISFLQMTTRAEVPYGSDALGSKYQGQRGPTPSRYRLEPADLAGPRPDRQATEW